MKSKSSAIICEQLCDRVQSSAIAGIEPCAILLLWTMLYYYSCDRLRSSAIECDEIMKYQKSNGNEFKSSPEIKDISSPLTIISGISYYTPEQ